MLFYRNGIEALNNTDLEWSETYINSTSDTSSDTTYGYVNNSSLLAVSNNNQYVVAAGQALVTVSSTTTIYVNIKFQGPGGVTCTRGNPGQTYLYAIKLA